MSNTIYCQSLFTEITACLDAIPGATDYAAGVQCEDLRKLLREYSTADMVIFRCSTSECDPRSFWVTLDQLQDADGWIACEYCGQACNRLLADGSWQSEVERRQLNARHLQEAM